MRFISCTLLSVLLLAVRLTPSDGWLWAALAAAENGKMVLCEKPLAMNMADAREMAGYCDLLFVAALEGIPDGDYRFEDCLDDDGQGNEDIVIRLALRFNDGRVHADFAGTAAQVAALRDFGARIGLAFQLVDDALDGDGVAAVAGADAGRYVTVASTTSTVMTPQSASAMSCALPGSRGTPPVRGSRRRGPPRFRA